MFKKSIAVTLLLGAVFGCTRGAEKGSPQSVLGDYVARSFAVKTPADKSKLVELTTGQAKSTLEALDEKTFRENFVDEKKDFVSLKIRDERKLDENHYSITYELTYMNSSAESKDKITNKKAALFANEDGKWLISEVRSVKTYIEHQNEMSIGP